MVFLVVDTQNPIVCERLYHFELFKRNVWELLESARRNKVEVIYVWHNDYPDEGVFDPVQEIYSGFAPQENEKIFVKTVNSPFRSSGLLEYLREKKESQIMLVGLMTDYCIDATVKCGFEHGFEILIPSNCNSTFDNAYMTAENTYKYYNEFIWNNRYAKTLSMEQAEELLREIK